MTHVHQDHSDGGFDPKYNKVIAAVGAISLFLVIGSFVVGDQYFRRMKHDKIQERVLSVENPELIELRMQENIALQEYDWINRSEGTVRIPIERAMELTAAEAGRDEAGQ